MNLRRSRRSEPTGPFPRLPPLVGAGASTSRDGESLIAVLVYDGVTSSEVEVAAEHLSGRTGVPAVFVSMQRGACQGIEPVRDVIAGFALAEISHADIVVIPGGVGWRRLADDDEVLDWLRTSCARAKGVVALSTGPLLLAAAGLLEGAEATCHWLAAGDLERLGARPTYTRVAASLDERLVTAAGARSADDACARLVDRLQWGR